MPPTMRSILFFSLFFIACAGQSAPPRQVAGSPQAAPPAGEEATHVAPPRLIVSNSGDRTHFEGGDIVLDLPGRWVEHVIERGYELRKGDREQIIVSRFPPVQGLDSIGSAERLADVQQRTVAEHCTRRGDASLPAPATTPPHAIRSHVTCEEPRVVATLLAAPLGTDVLSYEHYWYGTRAFSSELERADETILSTLQHRPR
jgi:hypothetical protein